MSDKKQMYRPKEDAAADVPPEQKEARQPVRSSPARPPLPPTPRATAKAKKEKKKAGASLWVIRVLALICVLVFVFSGIKLVQILLTYKQAGDEYKEVRQKYVISTPVTSGEEEVLPRFDFAALEEANPDFAAWIEIPGTSISYPVLLGATNDTYLRHTFEKTYNIAGSIFIDYRNAKDLSSYHTLIYGHNMKDGSMFGELGKYLDKDFFEEHKTIYLYTKTATYEYEAVAARETNIEDPAYQLGFTDEQSFYEYLGHMSTLGGGPIKQNNLLTLSTCTNVEDDDRYIVQASLVQVLPAEE